MEDDIDYLTDLYYGRISKQTVRNISQCEVCFTDLLVDAEENLYVCPSCAIGYPMISYSCFFYERRKSPPYKRRWHFMTKVRKLGFLINCNELELLLSAFIKLDHAYTTRYQKKNMVNMDFTLKYLAEQLGYNHIADRIKIHRGDQAMKRWHHTLNLALYK